VPEEASTSYCTAGFNFPFFSLFFAFPWSRENAIDTTPMHKPPSRLSCFHKSASKQGVDASIHQHREPSSAVLLSLSFARCTAILQPPQLPATYIRHVYIYIYIHTYTHAYVNAVVTATDPGVQFCKRAAFPHAAGTHTSPRPNVTSQPTSNLSVYKADIHNDRYFDK